jgi:hypothetical protein
LVSKWRKEKKGMQVASTHSDDKFQLEQFGFSVGTSHSAACSFGWWLMAGAGLF